LGSCGALHLAFGSLNRRIFDFANAPSKFLASLGTSDMPKPLGDIAERFKKMIEIIKNVIKYEGDAIWEK